MEKNQLLAVIENAADRKHVRLLLNVLKEQPAEINEWSSSDLPERLQLGPLQYIGTLLCGTSVFSVVSVSLEKSRGFS